VTAFPYATVEVVRSGFVESVHAGSAVALSPSGEVLAAAGDPDAPMLPRSANKPLQLVGMLRAGLALPPPDLAVCASSHSGEPAHVERVRALLAGAGIPETALVCPPALPLDEAAAVAVVRAVAARASAAAAAAAIWSSDQSANTLAARSSAAAACRSSRARPASVSLTVRTRRSPGATSRATRPASTRVAT
jgi:hypothetical protein